MFAIIQESGTQYKVSTGDLILIDQKGLDKGSEVQFDRVLFVDGKIGTPFVDGAKVMGVVKGNASGEKIYIQKFKRRKKYRRRTGHRQHYTQVEITAIDV